MLCHSILMELSNKKIIRELIGTIMELTNIQKNITLVHLQMDKKNNDEVESIMEHLI